LKKKAKTASALKEKNGVSAVEITSYKAKTTIKERRKEKTSEGHLVDDIVKVDITELIRAIT
jgi:hypothetical protein